MSGPVVYNGRNCTRFYLDQFKGYKQNFYELLVTSDESGAPIPVYFHFLGYDSVFGSHYDEYEFFYDMFELHIEISEEVFDVPEGI